MHSSRICRVPDSKLILSGAGTPAPRQDPVYPWRHHGSVHSRVMEVDPLLKRTTVYWYDETERQQWISEHYDVNEILEQNKALRNQTDENARWTPRKEGDESHFTHVFTVPIALVPDLWKKTHYGKDRKAVSAWLKAPENQQFLVRHIKKGV